MSDIIRSVYQVDGMTCGHCEAAVRSELSALPGVAGVEVDLGGGEVVVLSSTPLDQAAVRDAVDEAGYTVVP